MVKAQLDHPPYEDFPWPPGEDDLYYDDRMRMETARHYQQVMLLLLVLKLAWRDRQDVYIGANMFVYFSPDQVLTKDFRGPDLFVVTGVKQRERKSWVVWLEEKAPDVVIELLSYTTATLDKTEKKDIYQNTLRVPEYIWYDPWSAELAGWSLRDGVYLPVEPDTDGAIPCHATGLKLIRWHGVFDGVEATWLRWATMAGELLPTPDELAEQQQQAAVQAEQRAAALEAQLAAYQRRFGDLTGEE